jgi:hypothetical protein
MLRICGCLVVKVKFKNSDSNSIVLIANHPEPKDDFELRLFQSSSLLAAHFGLPVYPMVIPFADKPIPPGLFEITFPDLTPVTFRYRVVRPVLQPWRSLTTKDHPVSAALISWFMRYGFDRMNQRLACLAMITRLELDKDKRTVLTAIVETYLRPNPSEARQFSRVLNNLPPDQKEQIIKLVKNSAVARLKNELSNHWLDLETSWFRQGYKEGYKQGLELAKIDRILH